MVLGGAGAVTQWHTRGSGLGSSESNQQQKPEGKPDPTVLIFRGLRSAL